MFASYLKHVRLVTRMATASTEITTVAITAMIPILSEDEFEAVGESWLIATSRF